MDFKERAYLAAQRRGYPKTGTGIRAGARLERLMRRALGDPFAASNKCIARIKARLAATA